MTEVWRQPEDTWGGLGGGRRGRSERRVVWTVCTVSGEHRRLSSGPTREHGLWVADPLHLKEAPEWEETRTVRNTDVKICSTKARGP